jgi:hypothetical protein
MIDTQAGGLAGKVQKMAIPTSVLRLLGKRDPEIK